MVQHGVTGFLVPVGDVAGLVTCLDQLLTNRSLQAALGRKARDAADARYSPDSVARATLAAYFDLLAPDYQRIQL
jgi:glycosyltransferase involved in cell wall biosynthesis